MFGGNINPSRGRDARTADTEHGGVSSSSSLKDNKPGGEGNTSGNPGDGFHHVELHENETGWHSKHTSPDGQEDHADHGSYDEASEHIDRAMGHDDLGKEDGGDEPSQADGDNDDQPDFSAAYSRNQ